MARRRYLSTDISKDRRVADLVTRAGMPAALLYTWLIPHAADDATLPSDPEELLGTVAPLLAIRGMESISDVVAFIEAAVDLGLLERGTGGTLRFPESFYTHQSYIKGERRGSPQPETPAPSPQPTPDTSAEQRDSPQISAEPRTSAQNVASSSSSSPVSSSSSSPVSSPAPSGAPRTPVPKPKSKHLPVDEDFIETLIAEYGPKLGGADGVRFTVEAALNHTASHKAIDQRLYVRTWLRRDSQAEHGPPTSLASRRATPPPLRQAMNGRATVIPEYQRPPDAALDSGPYTPPPCGGCEGRLPIHGLDCPERQLVTELVTGAA